MSDREDIVDEIKGLWNWKYNSLQYFPTLFMQNKLDIFITLDLTLESCSHGPSNPAKYENIQDVTSKFKKGILKSRTSLKAGWP